MKKSKSNKTHEVFIVLSQTRTYPARLIKMYTKEPYAHVSIAFDENLNEMYSFGRKKLNNPLVTGFIREDIETGVFGKYVETSCSVYRLLVTEKQHNKLREEIEVFKKNEEKYSYNFLGIIGTIINIPINNDSKYFCSQFVAYILMKSNIKLFNKSYGLVKPVDFRLCPKLRRIYHGKLVDYRNSTPVFNKRFG